MVSMPFRAYTKGWFYWKTYPNLRRQIGLIWENLFENGVSMPFRAYTKGWCYWKTYPNLRRQIGLEWENLFWKHGFNAFSGLYEGLVLLKDLSKPSTPNKTYMRKSIWKRIGSFVGPTPHGFTWGLVLLKDLPKLPIPFGIFMPKSK